MQIERSVRPSVFPGPFQDGSHSLSIQACRQVDADVAADGFQVADVPKNSRAPTVALEAGDVEYESVIAIIDADGAIEDLERIGHRGARARRRPRRPGIK